MLEPLARFDDLLAGDAHGLAQLFEHYRPRLERMIWSRIDPRAQGRFDAADVLQETYMDATRQLAHYLRAPVVDVYVWLRSLAWQRLVKFREQHVEAQCRSVRREVSAPSTSSFVLAMQLLAHGTTPTQAAVRGELRTQIDEALAQLADGDRELLWLRHYEDLTNHEAAQVLGITDSAATMRYGRALYRLKEILATGSSLAGAR